MQCEDPLSQSVKPNIRYLHVTKSTYVSFILIFHTNIHLFVAEIQEICNMETFEAECGEDEVILMQRALYGRMKMGKCVSSSYGK